jgi:DNA polymerase-3 subunit delta
VRAAAGRERIGSLLSAVAPGNALCFAELVGADGKAPQASAVLREAVAAAGGTVREFPALTRERMEAWLVSRAAELGVTFAPGAARLLAERVGAYVREGDVDRRRQSELADAELQKLALFRPSGTIGRDDVDELVSEAVPGSAWAFLDAIGARRPADAALLAERLLSSGFAIPLLVSQVHRRLRDLIVVREHLDTGTRPSDLPRVMKLQPFRAQKLVEQASLWSLAALEGALRGLLELDLRSKGISLDGSTVQMSDARDGLGVQLWLAEHVARR